MKKHIQIEEGAEEVVEKVAPAKRPRKKKVVIAILAVILAAALAAGAWFWQQQKINALDKQRADLTSKVNEAERNFELQKGANTQLKAQVEELNNQLATIMSPEQAKLSIVVNEANHAPRPTNVQGDTSVSDLIYVDITLTNTSNTLDGYFYQSNLTLKDLKDYSVYPLCQNSPIGYYTCQSGLFLPAGKTELIGQTIPAGETVRGIVAFYARKDLKAANLIFDETTYEIEIGNWEAI